MSANARRRDRKTYSFTMSVPDVVWAGIGAAFALTVFFLFGVLVGRGYVPVEPGDSAEIPVAEHGDASVMAPSDEAPTLAGAQGAEGGEDSEVLKAEDLAYQDQLAGTGDAPSAARPAAEPPAESSVEARAGDEPAAEGGEEAAQAQAPEEKPLFDPANLPAPMEGEEVFDYVYQAAAFREKDAAEQLAETLRSKNLPVRIDVGEASGSTWYRVRMPFTGTPSQTRPLRDAAEAITGEKPVMVSKKGS